MSVSETQCVFIMKRTIIFSFIILSFCGFVINHPRVYVIFKNSSNENFKRLHIKIMGFDYFFSDVKSGKSTKPIKVEKTYRYCYAEAITSKDIVFFQPIDYVGEILYKYGKVTMDFFIFPEEGEGRALRMR